jgi:hypothetical protein
VLVIWSIPLVKNIYFRTSEGGQNNTGEPINLLTAYPVKRTGLR